MTHYRDQEFGVARHGQSLSSYFREWFGLKKHTLLSSSARSWARKHGIVFITFGFVRNPYTRLVSAFQFLKRWKNCSPYVRVRIDGFEGVQGFLKSDYCSDNPGPDNIFRPQTFWLCGPVPDSPILVDHVGRTEALADDIAEIRKRIGIEPTDTITAFVNRSARLPGEISWTDDLVERVQRRYQADFAVFGYGPAPPKPQQT